MADKVVKQIELRTSAPGADQVPGVFARIGQSIVNLKKTGTSEGLESIGKIFGGRGPFGGMIDIGRHLRTVVETVGELNRELRQGSITTGEWVEKAAGSLPVVGDIIKAGRELRAIFDGTAAEIERIEASTNRSNIIFDAQKRGLQDRIKFTKEWADIIRGTGEDLARLGLTGFPLQREVLSQETGAAQREISEKLKQQVEQENKTFNDAVKKLREDQQKIVVPEFDPRFSVSGKRDEKLRRERDEALAARRTIDEQIVSLTKRRNDTILELRAKATEAESALEMKASLERRKIAIEEADQIAKQRNRGGRLLREPINFAKELMRGTVMPFVREAMEGFPEDMHSKAARRVAVDKIVDEAIRDSQKERDREKAKKEKETPVAPDTLGPASAFDARFLTGAGGGMPALRNSERTAKATEQTSQKMDKLILSMERMMDMMNPLDPAKGF